MKKYNKPIVKIISLVFLLLFIVEVLLLLLLVTQNVRYTNYWAERRALPSQSNELLYVALGDSAGASIGAYSPEKGYVGLIAKALEEKTGKNVRVINLSMPGATVNDGIKKQLSVLKTYQPDVITVELGANDVVKGWSEPAFRRDMSMLMEGLPKHALVSDLPYFGGGIKRTAEKNVPRANQIIRELAAEKGLTVAPLYEVTKAKDSPLIYAADYFHPNNRGHHNWFEAFWRELDQRVY